MGEPTCQQLQEMSANHFTEFLHTARTYSCSQLSDCQRAKELIYIPQQFTAQLLRQVDESYADSKELYYKLNYTVPMQTFHGQTIIYRWKNGKEIGVLNTEMHVNDNELYAVFGRNNRFRAKQKYQIIQFMTADEMVVEYGICICDLPKGLMYDLEAESDAIEVSEQVINDFFLGQTTVKFIASQQNGKKARFDGQGCIEMTRKEFRLAAIESLQWMRKNNASLPLIADLQNKSKYFSYDLAKVLPVYLKKHDAFVGLIFKATGVYKVAIDMKDLRNKANLIQNIPVNSKAYEWMFCPNRINNLQMINAFDDDIPQNLPRPMLTNWESVESYATAQSESTYCQDSSCFNRSPSSSSSPSLASQSPSQQPVYSVSQPAVMPSFQLAKMNIHEMNAHVSEFLRSQSEPLVYFTKIANSLENFL